MRPRFLPALLAVGLSSGAPAPGLPSASPPAAPALSSLALPVLAPPDSARLLARVRALAAPSLAGRGNGTPAALAAADTIAAWFAAAGLEPGGGPGWYQDFTLSATATRALAGLPARNVLGRLRGRGALAGQWVIVGAHYDHLGREAPAAGQAGAAAASAAAPDSATYFPGADDNASGVAALAELARAFATAGGQAPARGVLFAAFAGEEDGLQGSAWLARHLPWPADSLAVMLNLDTIGRLRDGRLYVGGVGTAAAFPDLLARVNGSHGLRLEMGRGGWDASDHVSFNALDVPVLFLMTGPHADYHTPRDDWARIQAGGLARVTSFAADLLAELRARPGRLPYVAVAEAPAPRDAAPGDAAGAAAPPLDRGAGGGGRRAWFGIIPDFVEGAGGVKLAGVMPGSPAAAAGLARDDVLEAFAGRRVHDLAEYAAALRGRAPGDTVQVEVRRGGQLLARTVVLAARADKP